MSTSHPTSSVLLHAYYVPEYRETLYKHLTQTEMVVVLVAALQLKLGAFSSLLALVNVLRNNSAGCGTVWAA